jgi:hypothetical protein
MIDPSKPHEPRKLNEPTPLLHIPPPLHLHAHPAKPVLEQHHDHDTTHDPTTSTSAPLRPQGWLRYTDRYPLTTEFLDQYSTAIKAATGVGSLVHYLRLRRAIDVGHTAGKPVPFLNVARRAGVAGLGWAAVWLGVLTATTIASEARVRHKDPIDQEQRHPKAWAVRKEHLVALEG